MVDRQFTEDLKVDAFGTSGLATELVGRWLATDQAASGEDIATLASQGEQAIVEDAVLASVAKAYLTWRDLHHRRAGRGGPSHPGERRPAHDGLRCRPLSCDGSLVRIVRKFDDTRRALQHRLRRSRQPWPTRRCTTS